MGFILFSVLLTLNHSERIPLRTERTYLVYKKALMNMKSRKSWNNEENVIIKNIDLCTNVDGKIMA